MYRPNLFRQLKFQTSSTELYYRLSFSHALGVFVLFFSFFLVMEHYFPQALLDRKYHLSFILHFLEPAYF